MDQTLEYLRENPEVVELANYLSRGFTGVEVRGIKFDFPRPGRLLPRNFLDMHITIDTSDGEFHVRSRIDSGPLDPRALDDIFEYAKTVLVKTIRNSYKKKVEV
jgi:hypothetical protein